MKIKKLIIVLGCCVITLFSLVFVGCKRDTAKANIISGDYLLELPMLTSRISGGASDGFNIILPSMYIGQDSDGYYVYYVSSPNGISSSYIKSYFGSNLYLLYAYNHIEQGTNQTRFGALTDSSLGYSTIDMNNAVSLNHIVNNAVRLDVQVSYPFANYRFFDANGNNIGEIIIYNIRPIGYIEADMYSFNIIMGDFNEEDVNIIYSDGYQDGYVSGYNMGVADGFGATTPFDVFVDTIESFLDIELFGFFKISSLFYISFGLIMLGIVIKVFLGG